MYFKNIFKKTRHKTFLFGFLIGIFVLVGGVSLFGRADAYTFSDFWWANNQAGTVGYQVYEQIDGSQPDSWKSNVYLCKEGFVQVGINISPTYWTGSRHFGAGFIDTPKPLCAALNSSPSVYVR